MSGPLKGLTLLSLVMPLLLTGCADVPIKTPRLVFDEEPAEVPRKLIPVWTDTILHTTGQNPTRGFGGRLMFYGSDETKAIQVDGTLVVYAWDDTDAKSMQSPDRKYVFPADKLSSHYSSSKVGDSYSFWIPWDSVGQPMQKVMLICRFVARAGGEITSTPAHVVLQGPMTKPAAESTKPDSIPNPIQLTGHEKPADTKTVQPGHSPGSESIESTTILLPPGFLERNANGNEQTFSDVATGQDVDNPYTAINGSPWTAESVEPGRSREAGSRSIPRRVRTTSVAQRLADRARSQPRRSEWRYDSSPSRGSVSQAGHAGVANSQSSGLESAQSAGLPANQR